MVTTPTSLRGYTTDDYTTAILDILEHIPDVIYPLSVPTYGRMRREPALAAVLAAYTLPIRRASWSVNPAGCDPQVAAMVADDLGLPVAGKDEPGAARTKGVSWAEHLRTALSYLTFGHAGHELLAEMHDGEARLVGLYERVQSTVEEIHVDRQGNLLGISQELRTSKQSPQIRADRLVWYVHDREGANWAGSSLLRPAYGMWLIKQDLIRTHAIANRRWGAGVPVMEALPGTAPTPAQMSEAMQLAAAARAGEQAGAATPPGFAMKILGLSGAVPDTLAFIKYCDATMGRMALAGFLDLGSGDTGSYALAKSFVDLFLLNIQAIADHVADTVTRQVAARIVQWNKGDNEPVPAVQVADVGTKHDITAESLNLLLRSGALSADPGLEAQIRRMYRLPEHEMSDAAPSGRVFEFDVQSGVMTPNERRAQLGLAPIEGGDTLRDPVAPKTTALMPAATEQKVAASSRRRRQADGQLSLPIAAAAGDPDEVQRSYEAALAALLAQWPPLATALVDDLTGQAEAAVATGAVAALGALAASTVALDGLAAAILSAMTALAADAAAQVVADAAAQGVVMDQPTPDQGRLAEIAAVTAALLASGYAAVAARRAMQAPAGTVASLVRTALADMSQAAKGLVADHLGPALSAAQHQGRTAVFAAAPPRRLVADESNDDGNRCGPCREVNGRTYRTLDEALADYPIAGFRACEGFARCRGHLRAEWV